MPDARRAPRHWLCINNSSWAICTLIRRCGGGTSSSITWGQVDLPKLIAGGATLQMFTTVTKSPRDQNYEHNVTDAPDNITLLGLAQRWPADARDSLLGRALLQGERVRSAVTVHPVCAPFNLVTTSKRCSSGAPSGRTPWVPCWA